MIHNKAELRFYLMADLMRNCVKFKWTFKDRIKNSFFPDYIMSYLRSMRYLNYYSCLQSKACLILKFYHKIKFRKLGLKLGFIINCKVLGYGAVTSLWNNSDRKWQQNWEFCRNLSIDMYHDAW